MLFMYFLKWLKRTLHARVDIAALSVFLQRGATLLEHASARDRGVRKFAGAALWGDTQTPLTYSSNLLHGAFPSMLAFNHLDA